MEINTKYYGTNHLTRLDSSKLKHHAFSQLETHPSWYTMQPIIYIFFIMGIQYKHVNSGQGHIEVSVQNYCNYIKEAIQQICSVPLICGKKCLCQQILFININDKFLLCSLCLVEKNYSVPKKLTDMQEPAYLDQKKRIKEIFMVKSPFT